MNWKPQPGRQIEALKTKAFELLYGGARYGGKTEVGLAWLLKPFLELPKENLKLYNALVLRKNGKDLKQWLRRAREFYKPLGAEIVGNPPEVRFSNGAIFNTGHLADENSYMQYMGLEYPRILIEELNQIPTEEQYLKVMSSCRSTITNLDARLMANTNPGGPGHAWIKRRWNIKGKPPYDTIKTVDPISGRLRVFIPAKAEDNPIGIGKDPGYIKFLDSLPNDLMLAWRQGDWSVFAGQFFNLSDRHNIEPFDIPDVWPLWAGLDYGTGPKNATALGLYTKSTIDNKIIRLCEYYKHELSAPEYAREIKYLLESFPYTEGRLPEITYADPSMWTKIKVDENYAPSPIEAFDFLNPVKANNDRINGWRRCKEILNIINDKILFGYFQGYNDKFEEYIPAQIYKKNKAGIANNAEDLEKCDIDHVADEFRYAMMGENERENSLREYVKHQEELSHLTEGIISEF